MYPLQKRIAAIPLLLSVTAYNTPVKNPDIPKLYLLKSFPQESYLSADVQDCITNPKEVCS